MIVHLCPPEDIRSFPLRKIPPAGEEVIRVVEIQGNDFSPCCGTHCKSTGQIGMLRIFGAEKYKGMTRIYFLAGRRLLNDSRLLRQNAVTASRVLSVPVNETGKAVLDLAEKLTHTERRLKAFEEAAVKQKAEALIGKAALPSETPNANPAVIIESYTEEDINEVLNIGKIAQKRTKAVFVLASVQDLKFAAFSSIEGFDLRSVLKSALEAHGGKGGGSPSFFQGSLDTKETLDAFLKEIKDRKSVV